MSKKIIAALIAAAMVITMCAPAAFADETDPSEEVRGQVILQEVQDEEAPETEVSEGGSTAEQPAPAAAGSTGENNTEDSSEKESESVVGTGNETVEENNNENGDIVLTETGSEEGETISEPQEEEMEAEISTGALHQETKEIDGVIYKYLIYEDNTVYTGWFDMAPYGKLYFDPSNQGGAALVGPAEVDGKGYLFNQDGIWQETSGTPVYEGNKYWIQPDGTLGKGWLYLGNWKMYFDPTTYVAAVSFNTIGGKTYLFNDDGVMQNFAGTTIVNGKKYWFSTDDASLKTGWLDLGLWRLYFSPSDYAAYTGGVFEIDGKHYLFDSNGVLAENPGTPIIDGSKYWMNSDYSLNSGWLQLGNMKLYFDPVTFTAKTGVCVLDGKHWLFDDNGVLKAEAGTPVINGYKYWFDTDGSLLSGWLVLGGWKLYFDPVTFRGATGVVTIDGKKYVFTDDGINIAAAGQMIVYNGKKYCFNSDGSVYTGWYEVGNWKFYFDPVTGAAATGATTIDGVTYYFNSDGVIVSGRYLQDGDMYYVNTDGSLYKDTWIVYNDEWIYVDSDGTGLVDLSDIYEGPYMLYVDRTNCVVMAYAQDSSGNYTIPVRAMVCSPGLSGMDTPSGTYSLGTHYVLKELMGPSWGQYACAIDAGNGIYFHSVATGSSTDPWHTVPVAEYNKLGQPASHGCVRLTVRDALWIYTNCPVGTTTVVGDNFPMPFGIPRATLIATSVDPTDPAVH